MKNLTYTIAIFTLLFFACDNNTTTDAVTVTETVSQPTVVTAPEFDADSAYLFVEKQVDFGTRVPNTDTHDACGDWLAEKLNTFADTIYLQQAKLKAFDGTLLNSTNIIAAFNPDAKKRILLAAHWDTRPFADQDTEDVMKPILGANDGASGVGVLIELARILNENPVDVGVDLILFDSEDYGQPAFSNDPYMQHSYCLGSQYWATQPHTLGYYASFGILLDMVGGKNAVFTKEGVSRYFASNYLDKTWNTAHSLGYSSYFSMQETDEITDDHLYVNTIAGIPMLDIIEYDENTKYGFGHYWHTHDDNMNAIDKNTLKAVGQTITQVVYEFDEGSF
ncbi:MAG: M28 family peptidase [Chitinophagales bacterium]